MSIASSMPATPLENIGFSKQADGQQVATCKNQASNRCKLQDVTDPSASLTTPRKISSIFAGPLKMRAANTN
jgi:hypothetical protein